MAGMFAPLRAGTAGALVLLLALATGCGGPGNEDGGSLDANHVHGSPTAAGDATAAADRWLCPMHPTYISDRKGSCPICGMDLVPAREFAGGEDSGVPGLAALQLSDEGIALAGVRTQPVTRGSLTAAVRAVGRVVPDETLVSSVQTRVGGWIESLAVEAVGQEVRAGQALLEIYSPELLAGQEELLRALAAQRAAKEAGREGRDAAFLADAARRRLELYGVPRSFIDQLEASGRPSPRVPLLCPATGVVTKREAFVGMRIEPGMPLFEVTDLARVWVVADFYENEARQLAAGMPVQVDLPSYPGMALPAVVDFVYPTLDEAARTQPVRVVLDNPFKVLRPGMYASVTLDIDRGESLIVPDDAVLDTGTRKIAFVALGEGRFTPREVAVGQRSGGRTQILSGLQEGDLVVVHANFLLDSESRLRAALAGGDAPPAGGHEGGHQ